MSYLDYAYPKQSSGARPAPPPDREKDVLAEVKAKEQPTVDAFDFDVSAMSASHDRGTRTLEKFHDNFSYFHRVQNKLDPGLRTTDPSVYIANESKLRNYDLNSGLMSDELPILLTGFDPWDISDKRRSNSSGTIALSLHNYTFDVSGKKYRVISAILPNRWGDFDTGIIDYIGDKAKANKVRYVLSMGMGLPDEFDNEHFAYNFRGSAPDNELIVSNKKIIENGHPKNRYYTALPKGILSAPAGYNVYDYNKDFIKGQGTGGDFFCNEAFYRFSRFRNQNDHCYKNGFVHIPENIRREDVTSGDKTRLNVVCDVIMNALIEIVR